MKKLLEILAFAIFTAFFAGCSDSTGVDNSGKTAANVKPVSANSADVNAAGGNAANTNSADAFAYVTARGSDAAELDPEARIRADKKDEPVMRNLASALDGWTDREGREYAPGESLFSLWVDVAQKPSKDYPVFGVHKLRQQIFRQQAFASCRDSLDPKMFYEGGDGINTVGKLWRYLKPCAGK